jgi:hypothetical protein
MASSNSTGSRLFVLSSNDYGPNLWIVSLFCLCMSAIALFARVLSKHCFQLRLSIPDYTIIGAFVRDSSAVRIRRIADS